MVLMPALLSTYAWLTNDQLPPSITVLPSAADTKDAKTSVVLSMALETDCSAAVPTLLCMVIISLALLAPTAVMVGSAR